jgi:pimeloyl-ACP methyl ester carboxylesterase
VVTPAAAGPPIDMVFVHGGEQGSWVWDETIAALRAIGGDRLGRLVALDVPGCGAKRGRPTDGIGTAQIVDELAGEIDALGFDHVMLVGHSKAGTVLPGLAAARRAAVAACVHVACCAPRDGQTVREMMGGRRGESDDAVGWPCDIATASPREFALAMFCTDMDVARTEAFLAKLGHDAWPAATSHADRSWRYDAAGRPDLYVAALRDESLPLVWQQRFADRLGATLTAIDTGHQIMQTRPFALAEVLIAHASVVGRREGR